MPMNLLTSTIMSLLQKIYAEELIIVAFCKRSEAAVHRPLKVITAYGIAPFK